MQAGLRKCENPSQLQGLEVVSWPETEASATRLKAMEVWFPQSLSSHVRR
jgi:hypothetical protein